MLKNQKSLFNKLFVILIYLTLIPSACSGDTNVSDKNKDVVNNNGYTVEAKKKALDQCMQSGATQAVCNCVTSEMQAQVSAKEMQKLEADMLMGKSMPEEFTALSTKIGIKCLKVNR